VQLNVSTMKVRDFKLRVTQRCLYICCHCRFRRECSQSAATVHNSGSNEGHTRTCEEVRTGILSSDRGPDGDDRTGAEGLQSIQGVFQCRSKRWR